MASPRIVPVHGHTGGGGPQGSRMQRVQQGFVVELNKRFPDNEKSSLVFTVDFATWSVDEKPGQPSRFHVEARKYARQTQQLICRVTFEGSFNPKTLQVFLDTRTPNHVRASETGHTIPVQPLGPRPKPGAEPEVPEWLRGGPEPKPQRANVEIADSCFTTPSKVRTRR